MIRRPPRSPLFPDTPLFRSLEGAPADLERVAGRRLDRRLRPGDDHLVEAGRERTLLLEQADVRLRQARELRSEEHTSELQSRQYLVCRLLLEKKNNTIISYR